MGGRGVAKWAEREGGVEGATHSGGGATTSKKHGGGVGRDEGQNR